MKLEDSVVSVKGVGEQLGKKLRQVGIASIAELIDYYPRRYEDYSNVLPINQIKPGKVSIKAKIIQASGRYVRRGMHITEAVASDSSGSVRLIWFNQPYRAAALKKGSEYYISGHFELSRQRLSIMNPSTELVSDFPLSTARIVPVYRETKGLSSNQIRRYLKAVTPLINQLPESLPAWLVMQEKLMSRSQAVFKIHFPENAQQLEAAQKRLGFEEIFALVLASSLNRIENQREKALPIPFNQKLAKSFVDNLSFKLTDAQRKATWRIYQDIENDRPMNRLLEGDVGSGKTVVAAMAALMAMEQNFQVIYMAPTELLARQHADTFYKLLDPLGFSDQVGLLVGSLNPKQKTETHERIRSGDIRCLIGTNAVIQDKVIAKNLGLIIVDEQHRFGVEQRQKLQKKAGHMPHLLSMTATPIPRSLALTLYGELDISIIDTKPANRKPILTKLISPNSRKQIYDEIDKELSSGRQAFFVCPIIKESEVSKELSSAEELYKKLSRGEFKHRRVGLLHGKMKAEEKSRVMGKFVSGEIDLLVSTTVIEVGVDVPNATCMVIEHAERFGLAQMHQLRGRVGRSSHQGHCYLMLSDSMPPSKRLKALESSSDGFKLAELDLELRGPGAIYGTLQHGELDLRIAKLTDVKLIASARQAAQDFIDNGENLVQYKELNKQVKDLRAITQLN